MIDVRESGSGGGGGGRGRGFDGEGGGGGGEREGQVGGEEHVVGLDGGADEEAGEGDGGKAEAAGKVLVDEGLWFWRGEVSRWNLEVRERECEGWGETYVGVVVFC